MTDEFDDAIRSRLHEPVGGSATASATLESLKPAMRRARRRRQTTLGAMAIATTVLGAASVVGVAMTLRSPDQIRPSTQPTVTLPMVRDDAEPTPSTIDAAGRDDEPESTTTSEADRPPTPSTGTPTTVPGGPAVPTDSAAAPQPTTAPAPRPTVASSTTGPPGNSSPSTVATTPPTTATTPPTTATTTATTTTATTTTTTTMPTSGQRTIASACGSIVVSFDPTTVVLDETLPADGFSVDVKNAGPEQVEVGLAGGDDECEIKVEMRDGALVVDVKNPND